MADARNNDDRPKVARHGDCLLVAVPTARHVDEYEAIVFGEIFFHWGADYLITVRLGEASPLPRCDASCRATNPSTGCVR